MSSLNIRNLFARSHSQLRRAPRRRSRLLGVEMLEAKRVLSSTILVDDDGDDCRHADYSTIQAAVTNADAGDKIVVCAGTYREQVVIDATKNGLELRSKKPLRAIIEAPPDTATEAIVHVDGADDVTISGFTITRSISTSTPGPRTGITVSGGGSAKIERNHITAIRDEPVSGAQNGIGILVGNGTTGEVGTATILRNLIDDYQKGGIVVDGLDSHAEIGHNEVVGIGTTSLTAQNGVQISRGATAEVHHNEISGNDYTELDAAATGILLFESGPTTVRHNELTKNNMGIYVDSVDEPTVISHNEASKNTDYGIYLFGSSSVQVSHNTANKNGFGGILLEDSDGNLVADNQFNKNGEDGILLVHSSNNTIKDNTSDRNGQDGIRVEGTSSDNLIKSNRARNNDEHDYHDDTFGAGTAGTANFWENNTGETENRDGLIKRKRGHH